MAMLATGSADARVGAGSAPRGASSLWLAALAALLASSCCMLPLVFVLVGISGAWIAQLTLLAPYSPYLEGLALAALAVAGWRLYRPPPQANASRPDANACVADAEIHASCAASLRTGRKWFWVVAAMALLPILVSAIAPWFY